MLGRASGRVWGFGPASLVYLLQPGGECASSSHPVWLLWVVLLVHIKSETWHPFVGSLGRTRFGIPLVLELRLSQASSNPNTTPIRQWFPGC